MVLHLSRALDVPLREQNGLLAAAGYAPAFATNQLDSQALDQVRTALRQVLKAHNPNPAMIVNRVGDVLEANSAAFGLLFAMVDANSPALDGGLNIHRLGFHPEGLQPRIRDWNSLAATLFHRLEQEANQRPFDDELRSIYDEVRSYLPNPDAPATGSAESATSELVATMELTNDDGVTLRFVSMIATLGTVYDVTLDELRIEILLALDDSTRAALAGLIHEPATSEPQGA